MTDHSKKRCANCVSYDAADGCWNLVSFIDRVTGQHRRATSDDCCYDHERKPPQLRLVPGALQGDSHDR